MRKRVEWKVMAGIVTGTAMLLGACASGYPGGMDFVPGSEFDLSRYDRVIVDPVTVEFDANWNPIDIGSHTPMSATEREAVRNEVADLFTRSFITELEQGGNVDVVEQSGPDVLRITPVLLDVHLNAPLLPLSRPNEILTRSVGHVTLHAKFSDSTTGEALLELRDRVRGRDLGLLRSATPTFNQFELTRIFEDWAQVIRQDLLRAP